ADILIGGDQPKEKGNYFNPTVLKDVTQDMLIMHEETFGPIAPIQKFETIKEAIQSANNTKYSLAAYVFTENISTGRKVIERLDFGVVGWNDGNTAAAQAPFGGVKESGMGREGGHQGIEEFLELQYVSMKI